MNKVKTAPPPRRVVTPNALTPHVKHAPQFDGRGDGGRAQRVKLSASEQRQRKSALSVHRREGALRRSSCYGGTGQSCAAWEEEERGWREKMDGWGVRAEWRDTKVFTLRLLLFEVSAKQAEQEAARILVIPQ